MLRFFTVLLIASFPLSVLAEGNFFDSNGVQIYYVERGEGLPVVLVHGGGGSGTLWEALGTTDALADAGYRAIVFDMRGYGKSGKPRDGYGLEMSNDIVRLLDHLDISKAHVVGYSMGALVANRFRAKHPDRVLSATLGGGGALMKDSPWVTDASEFANGVEKGDLGPMMRALTPAGQSPPTQKQLDAMYEQVSLDTDLQIMAAAIRAQGFADSIDELRSNQVPTLALIGEIDPNKRDVDRMVGVMPNLEVVVIPGADHGTALRDPMFLEETLTFLAKHR